MVITQSSIYYHDQTQFSYLTKLEIHASATVVVKFALLNNETVKRYLVVKLEHYDLMTAA